MSVTTRLFEPGEAASVAAAQAASRPAAPARPLPRIAQNTHAHPDGAASLSAMRLFEPGEAVDVAVAQAESAPAPSQRPSSKPAAIREGLAASSLSAMRVFEPGEAADVAAVQNAAHPETWARPRPPVAASSEGHGAGLGVWSYPPELGQPPEGYRPGPAPATAPILSREPTVDPLLPEGPQESGWDYGVSIVAHVLVIVLVIARTSWLAAHLEAAPTPVDPGVFVALQMPQPEPEPPKPPIQAPAVPKQAHTAQAPEPPPREEAPPLTPPQAPKELPPKAPLPEPTRMGELVPVPHYPVPGTVPPEQQKTGKAGAPGEKAPPPEPVGSESGTNDTDAGAGALKGAGSPSAGDDSPSRDSGLIHEKFLGGLDIRSHRSGRSKEGSGDSEGGGGRRGIDFRVPGGDLGDFSFEDKDYDWNDYHSQMYYAILRAWYNRLYLMTGNFERYSYLKGGRALRGKVLIRFVIERSGAVSSIEVLEPSVMPPLDESARGALKEVILPRLPADFPKEHEAVTGRFIMDIDDVGLFKQELAWGKRQGEF